MAWSGSGSSYFDGVPAADLEVVRPDCYRTPDCTLHLAEAVTAIDRGARAVTTSSGRTGSGARL
jgi:NAD(P)H-nitrite reductase large subunit